MYTTRIGYVHLKVHQLDRSIDFYTRYLGLKLTERRGDQYAFLSGDDSHHEIALQSVGPQTPQPSCYGTGLYHIAFQAADQDTLAQAYQTLTAGGVQVTPVDHVISWAIYFCDPDGNGLAVYWDTRDEPGGDRLWRGRNVSLPGDRILAALEHKTQESKDKETASWIVQAQK